MRCTMGGGIVALGRLGVKSTAKVPDRSRIDARYRGRVRRLLSVLLRIAVLAAVVATVRAVLLDRQPRRGLDGDLPVIGSLDTWPDVPRKPAN